MQNSTASITVDGGVDVGKTKTVKAVINVYNATDLKIHGSLRGIDSQLGDLFEKTTLWGLSSKVFKPKSFTLIYEHNQTQSNQRQVKIGERQKNDRILDTKVKMVTISSRFAESDFQFDDATKSITCAEFIFDVSLARNGSKYTYNLKQYAENRETETFEMSMSPA